MNNEQLKDIFDFVNKSTTSKDKVFLKYLECFDYIIEEKLKYVSKYISKADLRTDAVFSIEDIFNSVYNMVEMDGINPDTIDIVSMFRESFSKAAEKDRRANFPMQRDRSGDFKY